MRMTRRTQQDSTRDWLWYYPWGYLLTVTLRKRDLKNILPTIYCKPLICQVLFYALDTLFHFNAHSKPIRQVLIYYPHFTQEENETGVSLTPYGQSWKWQSRDPGLPDPWPKLWVKYPVEKGMCTVLQKTCSSIIAVFHTGSAWDECNH